MLRFSILAVVAALGAMVAAQLVDSTGAKRLCDNIHWTLAYATAAWWAWQGARAAGARRGDPHRWFAWALTAYALGQVAWDFQVAAGHNPFPAMSDLGFIWLAPLTAVGLLVCIHRESPPRQWRVALLDTAGITVAVLALTLALYLPKSAGESLPRMIGFVLYPVVFAAAASLALVLILTLKPRWKPGWMLLLLALPVQGVIWLHWNDLMIERRIADGTWYNATFSIVALVHGAGARLWDIERSRSVSWIRFCEACQRLLPLVMAVTCAAVVVAFWLRDGPPAFRWSAFLGGLVAVLIASVRQTLVLVERERLLESERELRTMEQSAKEWLVRSEEKYRALIEQAVDGIFVTDNHGRILEVNPQVAAMMGMSREELAGRTTEDLVSPDEAHEVRADVDHLRAGKTLRRERLLRRRDGSVFWAEISARALSDGRMEGFVRDVSERRRILEERQAMEGQLRQSQKMEAIGTLAAGIAHDFNNILAVIRGNVELAAQDVGRAHPALQSLDEIRRAGRRATYLVRQLLAFARPGPVQIEVVDLRRLVADTLRMMRSTLPASSQLSTELADDVPNVMADRVQLEQVLVNLVTNAWQALDGVPGEIVVGVARGENDAVHLWVHDTGKGMTAETRERVFEPFFTTKPPGQGTGLGLAVVHSIAQSHAGRLRVDSEPGQGATFHLYLPGTEAEESVREPAPIVAELAGAARPARVLYVDDEESLVLLVKRHFERLGLRITGCLTPEEALETIARAPYAFDVIVTDYNMPRISGLELAHRVLEIRPDAPLVLTSGYINDDVRQAAGRLGIRHLVYKPDTVDTLCDALNRIFAELPRETGHDASRH